jgi:hypothetical protein
MEQNLGSGRAGASRGVTKPPAGAQSYSSLFVRLGKATISDDSWVTGSRKVVEPSMMYFKRAKVSYQLAACSSRRKICSVTMVPGLYSAKVREGGVFHGCPFSPPRISLQYSFKDNISNIFGRIVPKSGEFAMRKWLEIAVCQMGLIGGSLNPEADNDLEN